MVSVMSYEEGPVETKMCVKREKEDDGLTRGHLQALSSQKSRKRKSTHAGS